MYPEWIIANQNESKVNDLCDDEIECPSANEGQKWYDSGPLEVHNW